MFDTDGLNVVVTLEVELPDIVIPALGEGKALLETLVVAAPTDAVTETVALSELKREAEL